MDVEYCAGTVVWIQLGEHKIDALFRPAADPRLHRQDMLVVLRLHGVLGNLLDETEQFLPKALAERSCASITMNTALANLGLFYGFGVFDDVIPQIEAVRDYLRAAGFNKVILAGHGLGAAMAVRYAATRNHPASKPELVQGLVAIPLPTVWPRPSAAGGNDLAPSPAMRRCTGEPGKRSTSVDGYRTKRSWCAERMVHRAVPSTPKSTR